MVEFKNAVEVDPHIAEAQAALGYHYRRKGLLLKAADAFRMAASLSDDYDNWFSLGYALVDLERHAGAEDAFARCLKLRPADPAARYELAYTHYSAGHYAQAVALWAVLLEEQPDDWELLYLRASCYLCTADYALAEQDLNHALKTVPDDEARDLLLDHLDVAVRYQEFPAGAIQNTKDRLYIKYGSICLGSAADDGLTIPDYERYVFSYTDIAMSLRRFLVLYKALRGNVTVVSPTEAQTLPLALALGQMLHLPTVPVTALAAEDIPLVVMGVCSGPEVYDLTMERVTSDMVTWALSVDWSGRTEFMPDVVGVFTQKPSTLPWVSEPAWNAWCQKEQVLDALLGGVGAGRALAAIVARIMRQTKKLALETTQGAQVDYFKSTHRMLRPGLLGT